MTASSEPTRSGAGRPPHHSSRKVVLPDVAGLTVEDARIVLAEAGFNHIRLHYVEDYAPDFDVVDQRPPSGLLIEQERQIVLQVSRSNLIDHLPRIFKQSDTRGFMRGFLYIPQAIFDSLSSKLDRVAEYFDPRTTDPEFLPWLASWLSIALNRDWDELQTRKMLLAATRLFPYRGTAKAIADFVRIYTGAKVKIEENTWPFHGFRVGVHSTVGEDTVILPDMNLAYCFVVRLDRPAESVPDEEIIRIHQIIQNQKPAHTTYFLAFRDEDDKGELAAFMEVGTGHAIGVDGGAGIGVGGAVAVPAEDGGAEADQD